MVGDAGDGRALARQARRRRVRGVALSGGALVAGQLVAAVPAGAATFTVDSATDDGTGGLTLREAIALAEANPGPDVIDFNLPPATTITLNGTELAASDDLTISGPGSADLTIDGADASRVFHLYDGTFTVEDLTITHGDADLGGCALAGEGTFTFDHVDIVDCDGGEGAGIGAVNAQLTMIDSIVSDNGSSLWGGGMLAVYSDVTLTRTTLLRNTADGPGGGLIALASDLTVSGTTFDDNTAEAGGGLFAIANLDDGIDIHDSVLVGNDAFQGGGALVVGDDLSIAESVIQGNTAEDSGGGLLLAAEGGTFLVSDSTISGNVADGFGGGIAFYGIAYHDSGLLLDRSTVSGNSGAEGGGLAVLNDQYDGAENHAVTIVNSTFSDNGAYGGGGSGLQAAGGAIVVDLDAGDGDTMTVSIAHSTIAGNAASLIGGVYVDGGNDAVVTVDHSILADNGSDLQGSVGTDWSLIESPASVSPDPSLNPNNVVGVDPQLGPLQDNGGPTFTHMIPPTSPAFDSGDPAFPVGGPPPVDQRGLSRVSGTRVDRGAVERQTSLPAVVNLSVNWHLREVLSTGPATLAPFVLGTKPLVPIMGDWDGDGDRTPGFVKSGVFTLSDELDGSGTPITFTFGDTRGFPVAGDWDGDGDDEVAVYRGGTWQVRPHTDPDPEPGTTFSGFGTGVWPATVPVAGDWDGDGVDGIGFYNGNGAAAGSWTLRQTATSGGTNLTVFDDVAANAGYPVVGDWDGDGVDTVGYKVGATWSLSNVPAPAAPTIGTTFDFTVTATQDLPLVWRYVEGP